jgi:tetratricopeptide (TPR) repeat protein
MKKFMFLLLISAATVFVSFKYSSRVQVFFLKTYYNKKYTEIELVSSAEHMYDKKNYKDLEKFIKPLIIIYPDNDELKKVAAYNYLKLGNPLQSAELLAGIIEHSTAESRMVEEILKTLYYNGNYSELIYFFDKKIMRNNVNTAFYYGVALFKKGRFDESYNSLIFAKNNTFMLPEMYFYIGLNLDKKGRIKESAIYIKEAYESDRHNQAYKKALIDSYTKLGLFREAEIILRSR